MSDDEQDASRRFDPTMNTEPVDQSSSSSSSSSSGDSAAPTTSGASHGELEEAEEESDESDHANNHNDDAVDESDDESPAEAEKDDEGIRLGEDDDIDDEDKAAMFNLVMNEVLRQYREENGRGPDTKELLEMRAAIAKELDVKVAEIDADQADWNKRADGTPAKNRPKTIGFHDEDKVLEYEPHPNEHNHEDDGNCASRPSNQDDDDDDDEGGESTEEFDRTSNETEPPRKRLKTEDASGAKAEEEMEDSKPAARPSASLPASRDSKEDEEDETSVSTESTTTPSSESKDPS